MDVTVHPNKNSPGIAGFVSSVVKLKSRMVPTSSPDSDIRFTFVLTYTGVRMGAGTSDSCTCRGSALTTSPSGFTTRIQ